MTQVGPILRVGSVLEKVQRHEGDLMGVPRALDVMLIECRLCATRCQDLCLRKDGGPPRVAQQLAYHNMHLVFDVQHTHHSN